MKRTADIRFTRPSSRQAVAFRGLGKHRGFTLLELMIALTILAILTALAVPSFTSLNNRSRLTSQANELLSGIQFARAEAIRANSRVTFCGTDNAAAAEDDDCDVGYQPFWVVLGTAAGGGQEQLRVFSVQEPMMVSSDLERITFSPDGLARDEATSSLVSGEITVCMETSKPPQNKRLLSIASGSRMIVTTPEEAGGGTCE
jgi:type IV fimbrial biogenesis protein FimT